MGCVLFAVRVKSSKVRVNAAAVNASRRAHGSAFGDLKVVSRYVEAIVIIKQRIEELQLETDPKSEKVVPECLADLLSR